MAKRKIKLSASFEPDYLWTSTHRHKFWKAVHLKFGGTGTEAARALVTEICRELGVSSTHEFRMSQFESIMGVVNDVPAPQPESAD